MAFEVGAPVKISEKITYGYTIRNACVSRIVIAEGKRKRFPTGLYQVDYDVFDHHGSFRRRSQPFEGSDLSR